MTSKQLRDEADLMVRTDCFAEVGRYLLALRLPDDENPLTADEAFELFADSEATVSQVNGQILVSVDDLTLTTLGQARDLAALMGIGGRRAVAGAMPDVDTVGGDFPTRLNELLSAADEMINGINDIGEEKLLALDDDPHPPSTLSVYAEDLERDARLVRQCLKAR